MDIISGIKEYFARKNMPQPTLKEGDGSRQPSLYIEVGFQAFSDWEWKLRMEPEGVLKTGWPPKNESEVQIEVGAGNRPYSFVGEKPGDMRLTLVEQDSKTRKIRQVHIYQVRVHDDLSVEVLASGYAYAG